MSLFRTVVCCDHLWVLPVTKRSIAVDFLLAHHFSMETPFVRGVPYLSWEEEADARAIAAREWDKEDFADISIQLGDTENLLLMKRVREEIADWRQQTPVRIIQSRSTLGSWSCHLLCAGGTLLARRLPVPPETLLWEA